MRERAIIGSRTPFARVPVAGGPAREQALAAAALLLEHVRTVIAGEKDRRVLHQLQLLQLGH